MTRLRAISPILALAAANSFAQPPALIIDVMVGYTSDRWGILQPNNQLAICPLPATTSDCASGRGWANPYQTSPIPGYFLRHIEVREDRAIVLFLCKLPTPCKGDD